jgi:hypothetical protein
VINVCTLDRRINVSTPVGSSGVEPIPLVEFPTHSSPKSPQSRLPDRCDDPRSIEYLLPFVLASVR